MSIEEFVVTIEEPLDEENAIPVRVIHNISMTFLFLIQLIRKLLDSIDVQRYTYTHTIEDQVRTALRLEPIL